MKREEAEAGGFTEKLALTKCQDESVQPVCNPLLRNKSPQCLEKLDSAISSPTIHERKKLPWALDMVRVGQRGCQSMELNSGLTLQLDSCPRIKGWLRHSANTTHFD